jgi:hypothetical protein
VRFGAAQEGGDVVGDAPRDEIVADAREHAHAVGHEVARRSVAREPASELHRGPTELDERRLDGEALVEAHRLAVAKGDVDDRQMDAALRPFEVLDAAPVQVFDARRLEVLDVLGMVHDPHEIGVAETCANHVRGRAGSVGLRAHQVFDFPGSGPSSAGSGGLDVATGESDLALRVARVGALAPFLPSMALS